MPDRVRELEDQFEDRYGRNTEVYRDIKLGKDGYISHVVIHIVEDGEEYTITEYLRKDQRTDYVLSGATNDLRKYNDYLSAEVYVADLIGKKKRGK